MFGSTAPTTGPDPRTAQLAKPILLGVLLLLSVAVGAYGSALTPKIAVPVVIALPIFGVLGVILAVVGIVGLSHHSPAGAVLAIAGTGIVLGAALYVVLGVLNAGEPAMQSGCLIIDPETLTEESC